MAEGFSDTCEVQSSSARSPNMARVEPVSLCPALRCSVGSGAHTHTTRRMDTDVPWRPVPLKPSRTHTEARIPDTHTQTRPLTSQRITLFLKRSFLPSSTASLHSFSPPPLSPSFELHTLPETHHHRVTLFPRSLFRTHSLDSESHSFIHPNERTSIKTPKFAPFVTPHITHTYEK